MGYKSVVQNTCKIVLKVSFEKIQFCARERYFGPWHRIKTARIDFILCKLLRHSVKFLYLPLSFTTIPRSGTETTSRVARMSFFFERHNAPKVLNQTNVFALFAFDITVFELVMNAFDCR